MDEVSENAIQATFPLDDRTLVVRFVSSQALQAGMKAGIELVSGIPLDVQGLSPNADNELLVVSDVGGSDVRVDRVVTGGWNGIVGPRFIHGIRSPMEVKVPHIEPHFPYGSTISGVHVSVACCTGCNGGVHDRGLVVLNSHGGGSWSGIWVQTFAEIPSDYARWQKIVCCGGIIRDVGGSITVVDEGWMRIGLDDETSHAAPAPTRVRAVDLSEVRARSLATSSLEGCWVEVVDVTVVEAAREEGGGDKSVAGRLPRMEVVFSDARDELFVAWLHQRTAFELSAGDRLSAVRGFVHAEAPGRFVLLGDKDEDLLH